MYASIYCDPLAWLKEGSVDYISPQLYWATGGSQDYGTLSPWWSKIANQFGKHFYSSQDIAGLATSNYVPSQTDMLTQGDLEIQGQKINADAVSNIEKILLTENQQRVAAGNFTQEQIGTQIGINRSSDENGAPGSIFFSTKQLYQTKGFINYLKKYQFTQKALVPAIDWKQHNSFDLVTNIQVNGNTLTWNSPYQNIRFAVYAIPNDKINEAGNFSKSSYLLGVSYSTTFTIPAKVTTSANTFAVAVLDRYGNEFPAQVQGQSQETPVVVELITPANGEGVIMPFNFNWQAATDIENYILEIAEDVSFTKLFCTRELTTNNFSTTLADALIQHKTYYWRVKTRKANSPDGVSEIRTFVPQNFAITTPASGATNVSLTPTISWQNVSSTSSYLLEIATNNQFVSTAMVYSQTVNSYTFTLPNKILSGATNYFARVSTEIAGISTTSSFVSFTTQNVVADIPVFVSPIMNSDVFGTDIKVAWSEGVTSGYWIEISKDPTFPVRNTTVKTIGAYINEYIFKDLTPTNYYFRIKAGYSGIYTGWSDTLKVTLKSNTAIRPTKIGEMSCKLLQSEKNNVILSLITERPVKVSIALYSLSGTRLMQVSSNQSLQNGENIITIPIVNLANGLYLIQLKTTEGELMLKYIR
ncbi:MAG TPA: T9SS type A sorting domain-containing protein, partial [Paludibacter sp.]|nr:T9SS type A sorting domain-containing protein [Paludibacter sp.]